MSLLYFLWINVNKNLNTIYIMSIETKHIKITDYDYDLPEDRIAKFPISKRDNSKLLLYKHGEISHDVFYNLPSYLPKNSLIVFNNTKVIQARIHFRKETGALIEVFLMEPAIPADYEQMFQVTNECSWFCMVGNLKKWKEGTLTRKFEVKGETISLSATINKDNATAADVPNGGTNHRIDFKWSNSKITFADILEIVGELPIPPYLNRATQESDKTTYQTVYSKIKGSVAAPTAGLHFTKSVLKALDDAGIVRDELTLHVGAGTFKPVKTKEIEGHSMHTEYIVVHKHTLENLLLHNCKAIAVGTTSVRTLESLYYMGIKVIKNPQVTEEELHVSQWEPYDYEHNEDGLVVMNGKTITVKQTIESLLNYLNCDGIEALHSSTQIIIAPGFKYKIVNMLITNFHQPQSTLLLLVSAFLNGDWRRVYDYALKNDFRFLSYGDSSLLIP